ncbi:MAG: 1-acyl-sn-glycerol-3-phosphate acyltransferase [Chloroflexota bacterium]|nr:MAG: 1-acyl-sn-glycerol-3-phosphate acyltransferase [Chloroflexota bacterium]
MLERFVRLLNRLLIKAILDLEFLNLETAPREGALIVAGNHLGVLDALIVYSVIDRRDYIVMVAEYHREYAFRRFLANLVDAIFVDRYQADFTVLREVLKRLKAGGVLIISPEGTRSRTGTLLPGQPGTSYLAAKSGVPVLPVSIIGSEDRLVMPNLKRLRRSPVKVTFGEPIIFEPIGRKNRQEVLQNYTDEIMCQIAALLPESYRGAYSDHPRLMEIIREPDYKAPEPIMEINNN